jgi:hypothetical protein
MITPTLYFHDLDYCACFKAYAAKNCTYQVNVFLSNQSKGAI